MQDELLLRAWNAHRDYIAEIRRTAPVGQPVKPGAGPIARMLATLVPTRAKATRAEDS